MIPVKGEPCSRLDHSMILCNSSRLESNILMQMQGPLTETALPDYCSLLYGRALHTLVDRKLHNDT